MATILEPGRADSAGDHTVDAVGAPAVASGCRSAWAAAARPQVKDNQPMPTDTAANAPAPTTAGNERAFLLRLAGGPVSGAALALADGCSRAAVWKRVQALRAAGVEVDVRPGRGYVLARPLDLLDRERILSALPAPARRAVVDLDVAWSLDSTNAELLRRATPAAGASVLLAERQTRGRGRRGRSWASPLGGNLYMSVGRHYAGGLARLAGLSLVTGVAVADALQALGVVGVALKWPNDLVVREGDALRKVGGVLVEGGGEHGGPARAVIGLGINLAMPTNAAAGIDQPWTDLAQLPGGAAVGRNPLAATVLAHLLDALARFDREGLAPFLARYAAWDVLDGRAVTIHAPGGDAIGIARGLAADGALRVEVDGRERLVHAGDVSVRGR